MDITPNDARRIMSAIITIAALIGRKPSEIVGVLVHGFILTPAQGHAIQTAHKPKP